MSIIVGQGAGALYEFYVEGFVGLGCAGNPYPFRALRPGSPAAEGHPSQAAAKRKGGRKEKLMRWSSRIPGLPLNGIPNMKTCSNLPRSRGLPRLQLPIRASERRSRLYLRAPGSALSRSGAPLLHPLGIQSVVIEVYDLPRPDHP